MGGQTLEQPFCVWENLPREVPTAPSLSVVKGCLGNALITYFEFWPALKWLLDAMMVVGR